MRILLSDGSGLTARQCATRLAAAGHEVHALSPDPWCLCRFTRCVRDVHRVPPFGPDPLGWLHAALVVYAAGDFDVLFPTQEQVAVLAWAAELLDRAGVRTVVPPFVALCAVQDKLSAAATLERIGVPQPATARDARGWDHFPAFVKEPIGTASGGVRRVTTATELRQAAGARAVVVQAAADGPLCMCQSVFDRDRWSPFTPTCASARDPAGAPATSAASRCPMPATGSRCSVPTWRGTARSGGRHPHRRWAAVHRHEPPAGRAPERLLLGGRPGWRPPRTGPWGPPGAAGGGRRRCRHAPAPSGRARCGRARRTTESTGAAVGGGRHSGEYTGSTEELTPVAHDLRSALPVALAALATVAWPGAWSWFASGSVSGYALTPEGWEMLRTTLSGVTPWRARGL